MTLPEVGEMFDYWREHPLVHELVAAYLGYEAPPESVNPNNIKWELPIGGGDAAPMTETPNQPIWGPGTGLILPR